MENKLHWFKFSIGSWMMGKIQRCPEITQARFIRLCCMYWNKECNITYEDAEIEIDKEHIDILIAKKIVSNIDDKINISFLDEQKAEIDTSTDKNKESGLLGNMKRWHTGIFDLYMSKQITLNEAVIRMNKAIEEKAKADKNTSPPDSPPIVDLSPPDSHPIATLSPSVADKNRIEENREEQIRLDKIKLLEEKKRKFEERKLEFASTLEPFLPIYGKEMLNKFYKYWTEPNKTKTKFKQELEKTWSLERRLETWADNDKTFKSQQNGSLNTPPKDKLSHAMQVADAMGLLENNNQQQIS